MRPVAFLHYFIFIRKAVARQISFIFVCAGRIVTGTGIHMVFQQIRSATIKLIYNNVVFLIDPWLRDHSAHEEVLQAKLAGKFTPTPVIPLPIPALEVLGDVEYVLVTHLHSDHFTPDYLPEDIALVFQNESDMNMAKELGFRNISCFREDVLRIHGVTVTRVDGRHGDNAVLAERMGKVSGFVFQAENEKTIYVAGDTIFYDGVKKIVDKFRPEIIIVNACDAGGSTGRLIMNKEDIIELCKYAPDSLVITSHMDAVSHARLTRDELRAYLSGTSFDNQICIPEDGETIRF